MGRCIDACTGFGNSTTSGKDTYSYDPLSRITVDTQTGPAGTTNSTAEAYNDNGEATSETSGGAGNTLTYAATGADPGSIQTCTACNSMSGTWSDTNYDGDGNRVCESNSTPCTSSPVVDFTYNGADQLIGAGFDRIAPSCGSPSFPTGTECLTYDGNGDVATADENESTGSYSDQTMTWSTAGGSIPSLAVWTDNSSGTTTHTDLIDGPGGLPLEQVDIGSSTVYDWFYQDAQGNTRVLLGTSGGIDQTYNYDDYGNYSTGTDPSGNVTPLLYKGLFTDTIGTGLIFMQARWYDPQTAQFISQDPMVTQTLQPYAYAGDHPTVASATRGAGPTHYSTRRSHI